ncbi:transcriptional regulator [Actinomadura darangshiensis]|uniref:Transcriptional regulator n=1 Tax=Actinomadura darangshiensis TaxID=705336 RepID=A0A4V2YS05_9ACTN|nr:helix-turn-helix transcriptional regulator [Actinomadura darangshiensis]TDD67567.1 transcriptional regulator [Actinomadura darangshiensis]
MPPEDPHQITVHLDVLLAARGITLVELAERVGVTPVNLSILKNGRAKAIRFTTLSALCRELDCQPADLLTHEPPEPASPTPAPPPPVGAGGV